MAPMPAIDTVAVRVAQTQTFHIPRQLLIRESGYCRALLAHIDGGRFAEAEAGVIVLDEERPTIFALFTEWLRADEQVVGSRGGESFDFSFISLSTEAEPKLWARRLVELWIFGDRRQIPRLQNYCISTLWRITMETKVLPVHCTKLVYEHTPNRSPLRSFIMYCHLALDPRQLEHCVVDCQCWYNAEALGDLVVMSGALQHAKPAFTALDICSTFHVHEPRTYCTA